MAGSSVVAAFVVIPRNQVISGQTTWGYVQVLNNSGASVTVSSVSVYAPPSASVDRISVDLGAGAGGAAATVPSGISTINDGSWYSYPFAVQGYGAMAPGATPINIMIGGCVSLSDGTQVGVQPALLNIVPALSTTADTVNTNVSNTSTNLALSVNVATGGDGRYPINSGIIAAAISSLL